MKREKKKKNRGSRVCFSHGSCENSLRCEWKQAVVCQTRENVPSKFISVFCWIIAGALKLRPICGWFVTNSHTKSPLEKKNWERIGDGWPRSSHANKWYYVFFFLLVVIYLFSCFVQTAFVQCPSAGDSRDNCSQTWHTWTHAQFVHEIVMRMHSCAHRHTHTRIYELLLSSKRIKTMKAYTCSLVRSMCIEYGLSDPFTWHIGGPAEHFW